VVLGSSGNRLKSVTKPQVKFDTKCVRNASQNQAAYI
jgi:hypothetical protein